MQQIDDAGKGDTCFSPNILDITSPTKKLLILLKGPSSIKILLTQRNHHGLPFVYFLVDA